MFTVKSVSYTKFLTSGQFISADTDTPFIGTFTAPSATVAESPVGFKTCQSPLVSGVSKSVEYSILSLTVILALAFGVPSADPLIVPSTTKLPTSA